MVKQRLWIILCFIGDGVKKTHKHSKTNSGQKRQNQKKKKKHTKKPSNLVQDKSATQTQLYYSAFIKCLILTICQKWKKVYNKGFLSKLPTYIFWRHLLWFCKYFFTSIDFGVKVNCRLPYPDVFRETTRTFSTSSACWLIYNSNT